TTGVLPMTDVKPALLPRNLQALASLCRKEEGRYAMTGVRLITTETGYRAEATDGRMLGRVVANYPATAADYPALSALASAPNGQQKPTIPADAWKAAFKAIPKQKKWSHKPILDNVAAALSVLFAVGCWDRVAAVMLWYIWACLHGRLPLISNPGLPY